MLSEEPLILGVPVHCAMEGIAACFVPSQGRVW